MKEPYEEGVAHHLDPESCADGREDMGEALTGEHTGRAIELRNHPFGVPTLSFYGEGNTTDDATRESFVGAAESRNDGMCGSSMRENRETPRPPSPDGGVGRSEKPSGRTSDMHGLGESDDLTVPAKRANKAEPSSAAESVEGSGSAEGNASHMAARRTQGRQSVSIGLNGVRKAARRKKDARFTALLHHITPELLERSYYELKRKASPGVDGVTWQAYGVGLRDRVVDLHDRVHGGTYRALDALWMGLSRRKVNWVLDADVHGFLETSSYYTPSDEIVSNRLGCASVTLMRRPFRLPRLT